MSSDFIRVLLVEDNPGDARLVKEALVEVPGFRFEMTSVAKLGEALEYLGNERFDAILLDLSLPDVQGLTTVVRVQERSAGVPIIVLTGLDDEEVAVEAVRRGAQDYICKSRLDGTLLVRAIRYAIGRKKTEEQVRLQVQRLATLREIGEAVSSSLDLSDVLAILLTQIDKLLPYTAVTVRLWNKQKKILEPVGCQHIDREAWAAEISPVPMRLANAVFTSLKPMVISNLSTNPLISDPSFFVKQGLVSYLGIPMTVKDGGLGVLCFYTRREYRFDKEEVEYLLMLAGQVAVAIHNARLYEELRLSKNELEKALQIKSDFLGTMSHELRTPIHVIMSNTALITDGVCGAANEEQMKRLRIVERNARDLLRLVQGVLDITRIEEGKISVELEEVFPAEILAEVQVEFGDLCLRKGIALEVCDNGRPPAMVTDRLKIKEILHNLISNAMKFTKAGKILLEARHLKERDQIEFVVRDTGIGIKDQDLPQIFDIFFQADSSNQREFGGTGLGLYIVKRLVELLQGEVRVQSEVDRGTCIRVALPRISIDRSAG